MKLVNAEYTLNINFDENITNILVIENNHSMTNFIIEFLKQINEGEGSFVLSTNKILDISKYIDIIIDPFNLNLNNKKLLNSLYLHLNEIALEMVEEKSNINSVIINSLDKIIFNNIYLGIEHDLDFQWIDLFKLYKVNFSLEYTSLSEKLAEYMKITSNFSNIKIVVFVNIKSYLTTDELKELYKQAAYNKIHLLLIESNEYEKIDNEKITIIDVDNCIIVK